MDHLVCPVCGAREQSQDWLAVHVLTKHLKEVPCGGGKRLPCWCGLGDFRPYKGMESKFIAHCREHGGVVAHYLDCLMGVDHG